MGSGDVESTLRVGSGSIRRECGKSIMKFRLWWLVARSEWPQRNVMTVGGVPSVNVLLPKLSIVLLSVASTLTQDLKDQRCPQPLQREHDDSLPHTRRIASTLACEQTGQQQQTRRASDDSQRHGPRSCVRAGRSSRPNDKPHHSGARHAPDAPPSRHRRSHRGHMSQECQRVEHARSLPARGRNGSVEVLGVRPLVRNSRAHALHG